VRMKRGTKRGEKKAGPIEEIFGDLAENLKPRDTKRQNRSPEEVKEGGRALTKRSKRIDQRGRGEKRICKDRWTANPSKKKGEKGPSRANPGNYRNGKAQKVDPLS